MNVRLLTLAAVLAAAPLAGCGKAGALERPGPLFGATRPNAPDAGDAQDPSRPVRTIDPRHMTDDATNPAPPRSLPIEGQSEGPNGAPPQRALPDPYYNPR